MVTRFRAGLHFLALIMVAHDVRHPIERFLQRHFRLTFCFFHLSYFLLLDMVGTFLFWAILWNSSQPVSFLDCLFTVVSSTTGTGLLTISTHNFHILGSILLMVCIAMGSRVFTSFLLLTIRRHKLYYQAKKFGIDVKNERVFVMARNSGSDSENELQQLEVVVKKSDNSHDILDTGLETLFLEYRALLLLELVVLLYLVILHAAGLFVVELCFVSSPHDLRVLEDHKANPFLFGLFTTVSLFAGAGFNLIDESFIPFTKSLCLLIWLGGLILLGNTMYPTCLRGIIVLLHRYSRGKDKLAYEYLLQHSRKCFTHLFPSKQTMWLLTVVMVLNAIEMISFMGLEWKSVVVDTLNPIQKIVVAYFQSINTRHAGANTVIISKLAPALLLLYVGMMHISAYPVYLSRQNTKVTSEEQIVYSQQCRKLLARDSVVVFVAVLLLCIIEGNRIEHDPLNFSIFNLIFEVISAYANVGLSIGYSCRLNSQGSSCRDVPFSLSGMFGVAGKLVIIVVMILGKQRDLPDNTDAAVMMPNKIVEESYDSFCKKLDKKNKLGYFNEDLSQSL